MQQLPAGVVDRVLQEVLSRPEFAPPPASLLTRALRGAGTWVWDRMVDLVRWLFPDPGPVSSIWSFSRRALLVGLAVLGVALLVHLGRLWLRGLGAGVRPGRRGADGGESAPATARDWEERARGAAAESRWREASMALYEAVIHRLAGERHVHLDPGKTPGDYRREVRGDPRVGADLDRFVRSFEPLAFGRRGGREAYGELRSLARSLGAHG